MGRDWKDWRRDPGKSVFDHRQKCKARLYRRGRERDKLRRAVDEMIEEMIREMLEDLGD